MAHVITNHSLFPVPPGRVAAHAEEATDELIRLLEFWQANSAGGVIKVQQEALDDILSSIRASNTGPMAGDLENLVNSLFTALPSVDAGTGAIARVRSATKEILIGVNGTLGTVMEELSHFHDLYYLGRALTATGGLSDMEKVLDPIFRNANLSTA